MKKLILAAACFAFIGAGTALAQVDTTKTKQTPTQTPTQRPSDQLKDDLKGWNVVTATEVPPSLGTTLSDNKYKGWEAGTIYVNPAGDTYSLQMGDRDNKKTYYFDQQGKVTKRPDRTNN